MASPVHLYRFSPETPLLRRSSPVVFKGYFVKFLCKGARWRQSGPDVDLFGL